MLLLQKIRRRNDEKVRRVCWRRQKEKCLVSPVLRIYESWGLLLKFESHGWNEIDKRYHRISMGEIEMLNLWQGRSSLLFDPEHPRLRTRFKMCLQISPTLRMAIRPYIQTWDRHTWKRIRPILYFLQSHVSIKNYYHLGSSYTRAYSIHTFNWCKIHSKSNPP
jgi:hypothetical protein